MRAESYTMLLLGMRYLFVAILAYILFRLAWQSHREYRGIRRVKRQVEGRYIAYLTVLLPEALYGTRFVLGRESCVGKNRRCEIYLPLRGVRGKHALLFRREDGVYLRIRKARDCSINGQAAESGEYLLEEGDALGFGPALLAFSVRPGLMREEEEEDE